MYETDLNLDAVTVEDCINLHTLKEKYTVINDGKIIGFVEE